PGVLVALVAADPLLGEGRRLVDGDHDRAGLRVGRLPGVDGPGLEAAARPSGTGPHRPVRKASRSVRVRIPTGCPASSTSTAVAESRAPTTTSTASPSPTLGSGGDMTSATGQSSTAGSENARAISSRSATLPATSDDVR